MKPVEFPGHNVVFAKDQPEYQPLPALRISGPEGEVITCWEMTKDELDEINRTGRIYFKQLTFNGPLQPILPMAALGDDVAIVMEPTPTHSMISKKTWEEFRSTGLLLIINQLLHIFGWAVVFNFNAEDKLLDVYPARVKFRGFDNKDTDEAYKKVTNYLNENVRELKQETDAE
jgi:hypothetical protein